VNWGSASRQCPRCPQPQPLGPHGRLSHASAVGNGEDPGRPGAHPRRTGHLLPRHEGIPGVEANPMIAIKPSTRPRRRVHRSRPAGPALPGGVADRSVPRKYPSTTGAQGARSAPRPGSWRIPSPRTCRSSATREGALSCSRLRPRRDRQHRRLRPEFRAPARVHALIGASTCSTPPTRP